MSQVNHRVMMHVEDRRGERMRRSGRLNSEGKGVKRAMERATRTTNETHLGITMLRMGVAAPGVHRAPLL